MTTHYQSQYRRLDIIIILVFGVGSAGKFGG